MFVDFVVAYSLIVFVEDATNGYFIGKMDERFNNKIDWIVELSQYFMLLICGASDILQLILTLTQNGILNAWNTADFTETDKKKMCSMFNVVPYRIQAQLNGMDSFGCLDKELKLWQKLIINKFEINIIKKISMFAVRTYAWPIRSNDEFATIHLTVFFFERFKCKNCCSASSAAGGYGCRILNMYFLL